MQTVTGHVDVRAALDLPVPVPTGDPGAGGIHWLRANVARFSSGADHQRRRALAAAELPRLQPVGEFRAAARARTEAVLLAAVGRDVEVMAEIAYLVPAQLLAGGDVPLSALAAVARCYQPHVSVQPAADRGVATLVEFFGGATDEVTAARIGLLVQAYDATAGLVGNAAVALLRQPGRPTGADTAAVVLETLRDDPPVRTTRRVDPGTGEVLSLELAGARLGFGAGAHACPGAELACAIAAGVLDGLAAARLVDVGYATEPGAALRVPVRLVVSLH